jgi:ABC-type sugar transport system ATPase subunit
MSTPSPVFEAVELRKSFGSVAALVAANLSVVPGEVHGLLGENGAGKSTLIRAAAGLVRPDGGELRLGGLPYPHASPASALASGVRVVSQEFSLAPNITVTENLCLGSPGFLGSARRGRFPWRAATEWATARLREAEVDIDPAARVADLSVSQRQLVALVRGALDEPRVVFLDEPSSALDRAGVEALYRLVRRLRGAGSAVVYVSHKLEEVFDLTGRITIMRDGRTVAAGLPTAESTVDGVIAMMVGRQITQLFPARPGPRTGKVMLAVRGLSAPRVYGVDLDVREGEILGIGGLIGAGRTELAKAVAGLAPIHAGQVSVDGREVVIRSRRDAMRHGIEYMTEDRLGEGLVVNRPIAENVTARVLPRFQRGPFVDHRAARRFTAAQIARFGIVAPHGGVNVSTLSGGNQQKTMLAATLAADPRVVFLDEPTRGIDIGAKAQIYALVRELSRERAVVLISGELIELLGLADRILIMNTGRVVAEFDPSTASEQDLVAAALGR